MNHPVNDPKIVILGMGACGLGAAWRLQELGYTNYKIFERNAYPGGLAYSVTDEMGFTWDIGGHVQFSHYRYFDHLMDLLMGDEWVFHERSSWVWIRDRFVPYPFQNNIRYLAREDIWKCLSGLIELYKHPSLQPKTFRDWILSVFGKGIAELFLLPYNFKVWAYPPEKLSYNWIADRVSVVDLARIIENILFERDDVSWGPNNRFRFPLKGGTGEIWKRLYERLDHSRTYLTHEVVRVDTKKRLVAFDNGRQEPYDALITTLPLDRFLLLSDLEERSAAEKLVHSSTNIIGIGLKGQPPEHLKTKCWMYFPESNCPFYRVTVFSNYSPFNTPDPKQYWSLMAEVSESCDKMVKHEAISREVIEGALNTRLITNREAIVDLWFHHEPYGYPTPTLQRDEALRVLLTLEELAIFSRGRFGGWKYEVSNQDHSLMQGVEAVNRILLNQEELTLWNPHKANLGGN
ncbi:FAD-dependent oxidoreductase [bacterium]|nr:FAD-dependent oxidoreductase [bacterium]